MSNMGRQRNRARKVRCFCATILKGHMKILMEKLERLCCLISPDQNGRKNFILFYVFFRNFITLIALILHWCVIIDKYVWMNYSVFFFLGNCSLTFHFFLSITMRHRNRLLCRVASGMWQGCAARMCGPVCVCDPFELFKAHLWPASLVTFYAFSHAVYFVYKRVALTYFVPHNERSWWSLINYKAFQLTHTLAVDQ